MGTKEQVDFETSFKRRKVRNYRVHIGLTDRDIFKTSFITSAIQARHEAAGQNAVYKYLSKITACYIFKRKVMPILKKELDRKGDITSKDIDDATEKALDRVFIGRRGDTVRKEP